MVILLMIYCGNDKEKKKEIVSEIDPYLNHADTAKYVGMGSMQALSSRHL
jgi:hypothetical protein